MLASNTKDLHVLPALVDGGQFDTLLQTGQTVDATISPLNDEVAVYLKSTNERKPPSTRTDEDVKTPIFFTKMWKPPSLERRLFVTDILVIFTALRKLVKSAEGKQEGWLQSPEAMTMFRKLGIDYVNFIKECWVHASQPMSRADGPPQFSSEHYKILYTCFSLFVVLYLPEVGYEDAPVGDDLLEWLNMHYFEPSTEEGDALSALDKPWEAQGFWSYLTKSVLRGLSKATLFFLNIIVKNHPSAWLVDLTQLLIPLVSSLPRLQNYTSEREFAYASRRWRDKVIALRIEMDRVPESERGMPGEEDWWEEFSDIVGVLEGRVEVIQRIVREELDGDWKEVVVAWGMFIDGRVKSQDLPDIIEQVLDELPPDPTNIEDSIQVALLSGNLTEALKYAHTLDPWLAAHLADLMVPLQLIDAGPDEETGLSLRDYYVLGYAEYLHSDPALWRVVVDYMYSCGEIGQQCADEILVRVPLRLYEKPTEPTADAMQPSEQDNPPRSVAVVGVLKELNQTCLEYQRESVRRTVCRIAARTLMERKDYGLAVAYYASAEYWAGVGRVVDQVLEEYVVNGAQPFINHASKIAGALQEVNTKSPMHWVFHHRFIFVERFAHFQEMLQHRDYVLAAADVVTILNESLAPRSWLAVILVNIIPLIRYDQELLFDTSTALVLLQKLDEVFTGVNHGAGEDYLFILKRAVKGENTNAALWNEETSIADTIGKLQTVRLLLAQYFARCAVLTGPAGYGETP